MWLALGYLAFLFVLFVMLLTLVHEDRRAYLVSPVRDDREEDLPPLSPLPLRVVLVLAGFLFLFDAVYLGFLLSPRMLALVEGRNPPGPGLGTYLANGAFDLLALKAIWSGWRRRRAWLAVGGGISLAVLAILALLWTDAGLPRWFRGRYLGTRSIELYWLGAQSVLWTLLAAAAILLRRSGESGRLVRDADLAARDEPLSEAERVNVRWARGELTGAERDAVLADIDDVNRGCRSS